MPTYKHPSANDTVYEEFARIINCESTEVKALIESVWETRIFNWFIDKNSNYQKAVVIECRWDTPEEKDSEKGHLFVLRNKKIVHSANFRDGTGFNFSVDDCDNATLDEMMEQNCVIQRRHEKVLYDVLGPIFEKHGIQWKVEKKHFRITTIVRTAELLLINN